MKKLTLFLLIFCLILSFTACTTQNSNPKNPESVENIPQNPPTPPAPIQKIRKDVPPVSDTDTYKQNTLSVNTADISVTGLLDNEIQKTITGKLLIKKAELLQRNPVDLKFEVTANFSNVLSCLFTLSFSEQYYTRYEFFGVNFDLTTGDFLNFEDMLTTQTETKDIAKDMFLAAIVNFKETNNDFIGRLLDDDATELSRIIDAIEYYNSINFCFTPKEIRFFGISDFDLTCKMYPFNENIAIYTRFLTDETIFTILPTNGNFVYSSVNLDDNYFYIWQEVREGFIVNAAAKQNYTGAEFDQIFINIVEKLKNEIDELKESSDKDIYFNKIIYDEYNQNSTLALYTIKVEGAMGAGRDIWPVVAKYEREKILYNTGYKPLSLTLDSLPKGFDEINQTRYFNLKTGEEIESISQIFTKNYDYKYQIRQTLISAFYSKFDRTPTTSELDEAYKNSKVDIDTEVPGLGVFNKDLMDYYTVIPFSLIGEKNLVIFK